jgi:hypothetical protein
MLKRECININPAALEGARAEYQFSMPGRSYQVYFSCDMNVLSGSVEAALVLASMGAMRNGVPVISKAPMSRTFLKNQEKLSEIFTGWFPEFSPLEALAEEQYQASPSATGRVGCFFTGGVDSFYSFLTHRSEITDLVYVHGYDIKLEDVAHRQAVTEMGRKLERETGVRFIEIETNAIRLFKDFGKWGLHGHGYGLGAVARLLSGYLDKIYIPSSFATAELLPWASHPATDPLFSDEALQVVHDACIERTEKIVFLSAQDVALRNLRVCWENVDGEYNCGRCEKCLRTMTALYGMGVLAKSDTFPRHIKPKMIRRLVVDAESSRRFISDNITFLRSKGMGDSEVAQAWQAVLNRSKLASRVIKRVRRLRKQWTNIAKKLGRG